jgi:4-hydroxybenzoate polyprenyltransferase
MMGAGAHGAPRALPAAAVVAAHTAVVTEVSRREVTGGDPTVGQRALAATAAVAGAAALLSRGRPAALGLLGAYAGVVGGAHADAAREPTPARLQRAVGAGILGLMPLEAGLLAGRGALVPAAGVASLWPLARRAARKRAVT